MGGSPIKRAQKGKYERFKKNYVYVDIDSKFNEGLSYMSRGKYVKAKKVLKQYWRMIPQIHQLVKLTSFFTQSNNSLQGKSSSVSCKKQTFSNPNIPIVLFRTASEQLSPKSVFQQYFQSDMQLQRH